MKNNTNLVPLYLPANNNTKINSSPYGKNTPNIFINQDSLSLKTKKILTSNLDSNNLKKIYYNTTNLSYKNDEYLKKNENKNKMNNKNNQNSKNEEKTYLFINKESFIDSNKKDKTNHKIFNGKKNMIQNYYNMIQRQKNKNNHSFLESKHILKNESPRLSNINEKCINSYKTSKYINNENINLSNILLNKKLNKKNIDLTNRLNSNIKNELNDYSSPILKAKTFYNSGNQKDQNTISTIDYQNIPINRSKHNIIKIFTKNKNEEVSINTQTEIINNNKSYNRIDINKININNRKNNEKANSNKIQSTETNKKPSKKLEQLPCSPKIENKKKVFNSYISLDLSPDKDEIRKINEKTEYISFKNININPEKIVKKPLKNFITNSKTVALNNRLNQTNTLPKMNNFFQNQINDERKSENLKLNKNVFDNEKNFAHSPRFCDFITIDKNNNKFYFVENKNKSNKNIPSLNSSIFAKSNLNKNNSINIANSKYDNGLANNKNNNIYVSQESNKNNTKLEEKTHLIFSKSYESSFKTFQFQKNKTKFDLDKKINYIKSCSSISISGENEEGFKKLNQDSYLIQRNINGIINFNIFGVLDGHGDDGHYVSQFVSRFIINSIKNNSAIKKCSNANEIYDKMKINNYKLIEKIFLDADMQIRREKFDYKASGTTCVIIFQLGEKIICANVGDSRAIIVYSKNIDLTDSKIFPLSHDCKPDLPKERKRIYECGGTVEKALDENGKEEGPFRVYKKGQDYPGLAMSRSIGDIDSKKIGIIPNPEIIEYNISEETKYMIICSDGIWEFMSNEDVMEIANEYYLDNDVKGLCKCLYETSVDYWNEADYYLDDITAIAVFF